MRRSASCFDINKLHTIQYVMFETSLKTTNPFLFLDKQEPKSIYIGIPFSTRNIILLQRCKGLSGTVVYIMSDRNSTRQCIHIWRPNCEKNRDEIIFESRILLTFLAKNLAPLEMMNLTMFGFNLLFPILASAVNSSKVCRIE